MQYFKNVELAKLYPVSESAVRKWIDGARQGRLDLQLYEHNSKWHIANTAKNLRLIEGLVEKGKKYKNTRSHKVVSPKPELYKLYSKKQILDIISNVETYHEIPSQYGYFNGGAEYWDKYATRLWREEGSNTVRATINLLHSNFGNLEELLHGYDKVNIIDLGVGNCLPIKELLTHLLYDRAVLGRYIAVDISSKMLDIAERNINEWFAKKVQFERCERDFNYERFDDLIVEETLTGNSSKTLNLVLLFGGTLANLRSPDDTLRFIRSSMGMNDLLLTVTKLDTEGARRYFDFNVELAIPKLNQLDRLVLDLLGMEESFYEVEQGYDEIKHARFIRVKLVVDLTFEFTFDNGTRQVELHKGDTILLWRAWHQKTLDVIDQFDRNGFALLQASATKDRHYLLTISEIAGGSQLGA